MQKGAAILHSISWNQACFISGFPCRVLLSEYSRAHKHISFKKFEEMGFIFETAFILDFLDAFFCFNKQPLGFINFAPIDIINR